MKLELVLVATLWAHAAAALVARRGSAPSLSTFDLSCFKAEDSGLLYRGLISSTVSGRTCQNWNEDVPHDKTSWTLTTNADNGLGNHNYCRNPDTKKGKPWCFTVDPATEWEECEVPECPDSKDYETAASDLKLAIGATDCSCADQLYGSAATTADTRVALAQRKRTGKMIDGKCHCPGSLIMQKSTPLSAFDLSCYDEDDRGLAYRGLQTFTTSGRACQNWQESSSSGSATAENGLGNHNYCRNPDGSARPWCHTVDPTTDKEDCDIPACPAHDRDFKAEAGTLKTEIEAQHCECADQLYGSTRTTANTAVTLAQRRKTGKLVNGKCVCEKPSA